MNYEDLSKMEYTGPTLRVDCYKRTPRYWEYVIHYPSESVRFLVTEDVFNGHVYHISMLMEIQRMVRTKKESGLDDTHDTIKALYYLANFHCCTISKHFVGRNAIPDFLWDFMREIWCIFGSDFRENYRYYDQLLRNHGLDEVVKEMVASRRAVGFRVDEDEEGVVREGEHQATEKNEQERAGQGNEGVVAQENEGEATEDDEPGVSYFLYDWFRQIENGVRVIEKRERERVEGNEEGVMGENEQKTSPKSDEVVSGEN